MPDIGDERMAYREALKRAEEAALAGETPQDLVTSLETPGATPELEGAEPVQATDLPLPEDGPAEAVTPTEQEPEAVPAEEPKLLAGKYANVEELERAYLETQTVIGRQGSELGELRSTVEEIRQQMQTPAPPPAPVMPITQDMIENDPASATLLAYQQGNSQALNLAFDAWKDEDPFTATQWLTERRLEQQQQTFEQRLQAVRSEVETITAPAQEAVQREAATRTWREAFALVEEQIPGFTQDAARLLEEVGPQFPTLAMAIATGDAKAKAEGLTLLYSFDRGRNQDPAAVAAEAAAEARAAVDTAAQTRAEAAVVHQDTAGLGGSEPEMTPEQAEAQRVIDRIKGKVSLERGWTGRASQS